MKGLIQRVNHASVVVEGDTVGRIDRGLLLLLGVEKNDDEARARRLLERVTGYRIFPDQQGRMNCSLKQVRGDLLVVSQFTLSADTRKGMRPSFSSGATPESAEALYRYLLEQARGIEGLGHVASGVFAADMKVALENDGPVTFMLEV